MKLNKNTLTAINNHAAKGETEFFMDAYRYQIKDDGSVIRCEQVAGRTATSDWETVASWDAAADRFVVLGAEAEAEAPKEDVEMEQITIYANYGLLSYSRETVYSVYPLYDATVSEPVRVEIPKRILDGENRYGQQLVTFDDDTTWVLDEVLREFNNKPVLMWYTLGYHRNDVGVKHWRRMALPIIKD